ncbi:MAG: DUF3108 domain-containing protein [Candidatus Binatia bacterium]
MRYGLTPKLGIFLFFSFCTVVWAADKQTPRRTPTAPAQTQPSATAALFAKGEALTYIAKLNELPAGDGEIRLRKTQQDGREVYRVTAQGRTNELVDMLFNVRGEADGLFAASGFSPISFRFAFTERDRPRELGVRYDPGTKTLVGMTRKKERAKERSEPASEVYDPFSAFYLLRSRALTPGSSQQIAVFTGKDRYQVTTHVVRKENILLLNGERPAVRLHLQGFNTADGARENVFPKETTLWVSPDPTHIPLKLESFLPFGLFVVELNSH